MPDAPGATLSFIADTMLKKLAKYLRALGYDTFFDEAAGDQELLRIALDEDRILLTRDRALFEDAPDAYAFYLRPQLTENQLKQLAQQYPIDFDESRFLTRCLECNTPIEQIEKSTVRGDVPVRVYKYRENFYHCTVCDQIFWRGDHVKRLRKKLLRILEAE